MHPEGEGGDYASVIIGDGEGYKDLGGLLWHLLEGCSWGFTVLRKCCGVRFFTGVFFLGFGIGIIEVRFEVSKLSLFVCL